MSAEYGRNPTDYIAEKVKSEKITKSDGTLILNFINDRITTQNIMPHTASSYCRYLSIAVALIDKPVKTWNYQTFSDFSALVKGKYKPNASRKHIMVMKLFLLYLIEAKVLKNIKKEQIERVKLPKPNMMTKKSSEMLSVEEVTKIISGARSSRDRAIISITFESGCRPIELMSLEWNDVATDKYGAILNTAKKTGKPRRIRIIHMAEHLRAWKNDYPGVPEGKNPVFVNLDTSDHHALSRGGWKKIFQKAVKASGLTKRIYPYLLRHSRVTNMLAESIPSSVIGLQMWGSLDSQMLRTYGHLSDVQTDNILLAHAGLLDKKEKAPDLKPVKCPACGHSNTAGLKFCGTCGSILDPIKYQEKIQESPEALVEKMKEQMALLDNILKSDKYTLVIKTLPSGEEIYDIVDR
jgi:integrase